MDLFSKFHVRSSEIKICIFCCTDLSECMNLESFDERNKVLKLVFSQNCERGFRAFFWQLVTGEQCEAPLPCPISTANNAALSSEQKLKIKLEMKEVSGYKEDANEAAPYLPLCSSCLDTVVKINQLHSDLEKIQMLLADEIGNIQRNVLNDRNLSTARIHGIGEKFKDFQEKVYIQSSKSKRIPLVILDRLHGSKLPQCNVNIVKEEPEEYENSNFHPYMDDDYNWSPSPTCLETEDRDDDDFEDYTPVKRRVGRPRKETGIKRPVGRPRKETGIKRPVGRPRKETEIKRPVGRPHNETGIKRPVGRPRKVESDSLVENFTENSSGSPIKRIKKENTTVSNKNVVDSTSNEQSSASGSDGSKTLKQKMNHRLFIRKNPWKDPRKKTGEKRKMHFSTVFQCEICNKTYFKHLSFVKHKRAHEEQEASMREGADERAKIELQKMIKSKMNSRLFIRKNPWKPAVVKPDQRKKHFHTFYRCEICNKTYFKRISFLKHKRAHAEIDALLKEADVTVNPPATVTEELKTCSICQQQIHQSDYSEHLLGHEKEVENNIKSSGNESGSQPFACNHKDCLRRFYIEENLKIHMDVDHDEISSAANLLRVKKCDVCNICYNTSNDLLEHFQKVHKEHARNLYYCPVCHHSYSRSKNLIIHMHSHTTKSQQICFICKSLSPNRQELLLHLEQLHGLETKADCGLCEEKFEDMYLFHAHMKSVHKRKETYVCSFCGKICYFHSSFMRHVMLHNKIERRDLWCDLCNEPFTNKNKLSKHRVKFHGVAKIQCTLCDREYLTPYALTLHMRTHNKDSHLHCQICDKYFSQKAQLDIHTRSVHSQERPFACELCGFTCKTDVALKRHQETHDKKFECDTCGRKFTRYFDLKSHMRMHTGETIVCPYCGYEFHNKKSWKRHVRTYHESDNPQPLYRPQKTRKPCSRWKDDDGNTCHAKIKTPQQVVSEYSESETKESPSQQLLVLNIEYEQEQGGIPTSSGSADVFVGMRND